MKKLLLLTALAVLSACASPIKVGEGYYKMPHHEGGHLQSTLADVAELNAIGAFMQLDPKECWSACTLYLGVKNICIGAETRFGFHAATNILLIPDARGTALYASHLPQPVRRWFYGVGADKVIATDHVFLTGEEIHLMTGQPLC